MSSANARTKMTLVVLGALAVVVIAVALAWNQFSGRNAVPRHSVAVLPFENLSGANRDYLADGFTEMLINDLTEVSSVKVIGMTSSMKFRNTDASPSEIAEALDVTTLVRGTVEEAADRAVVKVEILDAASGKAVWDKSYDRALADFATLNREVARAVIDRLGVEVKTAEAERLDRAVTVDGESYRTYLRARREARAGSHDSLVRSIDLYKQALELDPGYAPAHVGFARAYIELADRGFVQAADAYRKAKALLLNALDIDSSLADALTSLGYITFAFDLDWPEAERILTEALEQKPNSVRARMRYAEYLADMRKDDMALTEIVRAQNLDPLAAELREARGVMFLNHANHALAIVALDEALDIDPLSATAYAHKGRAFLAWGKFRQAAASFEKAYELVGRDAADIQALAAAFDDGGVDGNVEGFLRVRLQIAEKESAARYLSVLDPVYGIVESHARLGNIDTAVRLVQAHVEDRGADIATLNSNPYFLLLRGDPRFIELLEKMGFENLHAQEQQSHPGHDH